MKKLMLIALILALGIVTIAHAGIGSIKMSPAWPVMLSSPAEFETWVEGGSGPAYELHVLIVMTKDCYSALSGPVQVYNGGPIVDIPTSAFTEVTVNSENVPTGTTASYEVASLKSHLSYGLSIPLSATDKIYYNLSIATYLSEPLTGEHQTFTVEVPSSKPRILVYIMGSSAQFNPEPFNLDMRTPPTMPGFIVPEPATIAAVATSIGAFGLYAYRRKRKQ